MTTFFVAPIVGGLIGYLTNDIAIRMLFRPHKPRYIFGWHLPLTPGIIPREKGRIAKAMGDAISGNLMNKEVLERTLMSDDIINKIYDSIDSFCAEQSHNPESVRSFLSHYMSDAEVQSIVDSATAQLETLLSDKLSNSNFGDDIAHMAIEHAMQKVGVGLLGMFGADKLLRPIAEAAEPMLAQEVNSMIRYNSGTVISHLIDNQTNEFLNMPMLQLFADREKEIEQAKKTIISVYRTIISEHLPKMLASIDISHMIEERINEMDMEEIEPIILELMDKELKAIIWFGAGLGALIGCGNWFI
ncbi:MAG: DUF445 family protein [Bacteroidales bacterium]|nr:DUF445 family protein [Bacteroidales bacterium]